MALEVQRVLVSPMQVPIRFGSIYAAYRLNALEVHCVLVLASGVLAVPNLAWGVLAVPI